MKQKKKKKLAFRCSPPASRRTSTKKNGECNLSSKPDKIRHGLLIDRFSFVNKIISCIHLQNRFAYHKKRRDGTLQN